jgi:hypothetical protein
MKLEDFGFSDDDLLAVDADYDKLATLMQTPNETAMLTYLKHIRKAHEDGLAAMRELGVSPNVQTTNIVAIFGALAAQTIEQNERGSAAKLIRAIDMHEFFGGCMAKRFKSLWSAPDV